MTLLNWVFCGRSLLLLHLNNRGTERGTVEMHSPDPCSLHHTHPSFFSFLVCVLILVYPCGAFPGQEEEEAADKDNYWESNHPQTHGFLSYLHLFCCILDSNTWPDVLHSDGKGFSNMVVKCNYSQTPWSGETITSDCLIIRMYKPREFIWRFEQYGFLTADMGS